MYLDNKLLDVLKYQESKDPYEILDIKQSTKEVKMTRNGNVQLAEVEIYGKRYTSKLYLMYYEFNGIYKLLNEFLSK